MYVLAVRATDKDTARLPISHVLPPYAKNSYKHTPLIAPTSRLCCRDTVPSHHLTNAALRPCR